jgi:hypothetical protein
VRKRFQILTKSLREYRASAKDSSKPVAVIGDIGCYAKQGPHLTEAYLFILE